MAGNQVTICIELLFRVERHLVHFLSPLNKLSLDLGQFESILQRGVGSSVKTSVVHSLFNIILQSPEQRIINIGSWQK